MSFFAVLDVQDDGARGKFTVDQLHVNLWSVVGLLPRRRALLVDVGVRITATETTRGLSLAVPFRSLHQIDLSAELQNSTSAALIFDSVVPFVPKDQTLEVDGAKLVLLQMDADSEQETSLSSEAISVWKVAFVRPLQPGETGYFRMRFEVAGGRAWQWQRTGKLSARNGLLIDIRIADVRSTIELPGGPSIRARVVDVERAYVFAVLPEWLTPSTMSPSVGYIRLLEPRVWGKYLGRKAEFWGRRLVVYQWKSDRLPDGEPIPVTSEQPLRIYGRFDLRVRFPWLRVVIAAIVGSLVVVALIFNVPAQQWVIDWLVGIGGFFAEFWAAVLLPLGTLGLIGAVVSWAKGLWRVRAWLRRTESWVFSKFLRPEK